MTSEMIPVDRAQPPLAAQHHAEVDAAAATAAAIVSTIARTATHALTEIADIIVGTEPDETSRE